MSMWHGWNNLSGKPQINLSRSTFSTKISTWTGLGLNPCLRRERPNVPVVVLQWTALWDMLWRC